MPKKPKKPWSIEFTPDLWEGGVSGLTPQAEYLYFRISLHIWNKGTPILKENLTQIARNMPNCIAFLDELTNARKVKIIKGNQIIAPRAKDAWKAAKDAEKNRKKRTQNANASRRKRRLTPGKQKETMPECNVVRNVVRNVPHKNSSGDLFNEINDEEKLARNMQFIHSDIPCISIQNVGPVENGDNGGNPENPRNEKNFRPKDDQNAPGSRATLKTATIERAKIIADGYSIDWLIEQWHSWSPTPTAQLRDPDRAFIGFVQRHIDKNPLP